MEQVNVGIIGLGNVGSGTMAILAENGEQIDLKLGFRLRVKAVCSQHTEQKKIPEALGPVLKTNDWRQLVSHPDLHIIAELVGGTQVAAEIVTTAIANKKSVVTANKELMASSGAELWDRAIAARTNLAMEASVAGGIPIHAVLREGISGDRIVALYGILNGTSNYILTSMENHGTPFETVLAEAQRLGYAEADPSNDVDGFDARSKLAILSALAFGEKIIPSDIFTEGIRRIGPVDFEYAHRLGHTIRLLCAARQTEEGLVLSVRPALISTRDDSGQRARFLQRGVGEGPLWRGHLLLRPRSRPASDRRRRGQRSDARRSRDSRWQPGTGLAVRAQTPGCL